MSEPTNAGPHGSAGARKTIGGFEIVAKIGAGGMGAVYKARQVSLDRFVALKVLPPKAAEDRVFIERFLREARSAAALNHPNIIQGIDVGFADGYHYFAMELVEGETLADTIRREGFLDQADALRIAEEMARALQHAHARGLVHRDVKPGNILIGRDGVSKLADLGLAKKTLDDAALTQPDRAIGTPACISPEQARGEDDVDIRSDIYSLGATLFHAVTGRPPYEGKTSAVVMTKHITEPVPSAREVNPAVSPELDKLIARMMAKAREDRHQTPDELLADIARLREGRSLASTAVSARAARKSVRAAAVPGRPEAAERPRRRTTVEAASVRKRPPVTLIAGGAAVAVAVAVAAVLLLGGRKEQQPEPKPPAPGQVEPPPAKPKETPPPAPDPSAKLQEMYDYAADFAAKNPEACAEAIGKFGQVLREAQGTKFALMAAEEVRKLERVRSERAETVLAERKAATAPLLASDRFKEAAEAVGDEPTALAGSGLAARLAELRAACMKAAAVRYAELSGRSAELASTWKLDEAAAAFDPVGSFGLPEYEAKVKEELGKIAESRKAREDERAARAAAEARKELDAVADEFRKHLASREYAEARTRIDSLLRDPAKATVRDDLAACAAELGRIEKLWAATEEALRAAVESKVTLHVGGVERAGIVRSVRDGNVSLGIKTRGGEMEMQIALSKLDAADVASLSGYRGRDGEKRLVLGVFMLAEGRTAEAEAELAAAKELGIDVSAYEERIAVLKKGKEGVAAERALDALRQLVAAKKWEEASGGIEKLRADLGSTKAVTDAADELARISDAIDDGLLSTGKVQLFREFSLPDVYFVDSVAGSDASDGSSWSKAWKSFDRVWRDRLPKDGGKATVLLRGRGKAAPYLTPLDDAGKPTASYLAYRGKSEILLVGVDDTGEAVLSPRPETLAAQPLFRLSVGGTAFIIVNVRVEGFPGHFVSWHPGGSQWIGCRFVYAKNVNDPAGCLCMSTQNANTPDQAGELRTVRDCLFVGAGATTGAYTLFSFEHCTFVDCRPQALGECWHGGNLTFDHSRNRVADCLFADCDRAFIFHDKCTPFTVERCVLAGVKDVGEPRLAAAVRSVPSAGFTNPAAGDYSLSARSPLRSAAPDGTDVGYRPRECLKAAMEIVGKLQVEFNQRSRSLGKR